MADRSNIGWTDATWNPVTGCTRVSEGCEHCYIDRTPPFRINHRRFDHPGTGGTTGVQLHPDRLNQPLHWRKPRRIFICSLADLYHQDVPDQHIADTFAVMALCGQHTFITCTKRAARQRALLNSPDFRAQIDAALAARGRHRIENWQWPLANVHVGVTVENQAAARMRIPDLLATPAAVRWLSCEPLLEPVDLSRHLPRRFEREQGGYWLHTADTDIYGNGKAWMPGSSISWVVVGGESGSGARPMDPDWARDIVAQCAAAGTPAYVKQLGAVWAREAGVSRTDRAGADTDNWTLGGCGDLNIRQYPTALDARR